MRKVLSADEAIERIQRAVDRGAKLHVSKNLRYYVAAATAIHLQPTIDAAGVIGYVSTPCQGNEGLSAAWRAKVGENLSGKGLSRAPERRGLLSWLQR